MDEKDLDKFRKFVYCKGTSCIWNLEIKEGKFIKHHKDWKPLGVKDAYTGICMREEVGVSPSVIKTMEGTTSAVKHEFVQCDFYSDKSWPRGHMDFSKLLDGNGRPFGGSIEPANEETFH